jgi:hypothetical protein
MLSRSLDRADIAGEAMFGGCVAAIDIARDTIAALLPPTVALAHDDPSRVHRCLIAFGEQSDGVTFFGGFPVPWNVRYHEALVAVPFVHLDADDRPHLFVRGMPCDFWPAVWNGNVYYGFTKQLARIEWDGERFLSHSDRPEPDFHAVVERTSMSAGLDPLIWIREAAALPVLGCRADGTIVTSHFEWDFTEASVEPVEVRLYESAQFPELTAGNDAGRLHPGCRVQHMRWRLSWPGHGGR